MLILGIESSCDETAAAVVEDGRRLLSNAVASQAAEHNLYGGVVPEIASRRHIENISGVVNAALNEAGVPIEKIDAVAATFAPGLIGALLVGCNFGKALAFSAGLPFVPVHHLRGHIAALYLTYPELKPPFLCLVASGGHSHIIEVRDYTAFKVLGRTVDDAAGEAFDKVSRTLGLGYPGGPAIAKLAEAGSEKGYSLPTPHTQNPYDVSFSGLKTAVLNLVNQAAMRGDALNTADLAASFQFRMAQILAEKLELAALHTGACTLAIAGGVAANALLRREVQEVCRRHGWQLYLPKLAFCGDNGAMIASQGYYEYKAGHRGALSCNALATLPIDAPEIDAL